MKLLVVEDDPPLQAALLRLLAQWGYATELASTAWASCSTICRCSPARSRPAWTDR